MDSVADLLALALQHDAMREHESLRRERIDTLDRLLHTMAEALDIRHIFAEVSDVVRAALPHDILALTSWADDGRRSASTRWRARRWTTRRSGRRRSSPTDERALLHRDPYVIHDVAAEIAPDSVRGPDLRAARRAIGAARADAARHRRLRIALLSRARTGRVQRRRHRLRPPRGRSPGAGAVAPAAGRSGAARCRGAGDGGAARGAGGHADARARGPHRPAPRRRSLAAVEGRARAGGARRADRDDRAADR